MTQRPDDAKPTEPPPAPQSPEQLIAELHHKVAELTHANSEALQQLRRRTGQVVELEAKVFELRGRVAQLQTTAQNDLTRADDESELARARCAVIEEQLIAAQSADERNALAIEHAQLRSKF